jgi:ADA HAT complex component 1
VAPTPQRSNRVHPFNSTGGPVPQNRANKPTPARQAARNLDTTKFPASQAPLTPSAQLPRLSAHFAKYNQGGDLAKAIADARQKVDLGVDEDLSSPDISAQNSPLAAPSGGRGPASLGINNSTIPRPASQKGIRQLAQQSKARPSPLAPVDFKHDQGEIQTPGSPHSHASTSAARTPSFDLSPHTTAADSNPGLVSDHEEDEDDHGSSSENEEAPPLPRPHSSRGGPALSGHHHQPTCGGENLELDVVIDDDEIEHDGLVIRRNSITGATGRKFGGAMAGKGGR